MPEREWPLGLSDKVWVNNREVTGTYDRFTILTNSKGQRYVGFRRLNCQRETYDLSRCPVYLEHHPGRPHSDTAIAKPTSPLALYRYGINPNVLPLDRHYPVPKPRPIQQSPESIIITADDLRKRGSVGFYVKNCGFKTRYRIGQLLYVAKDFLAKTITICTIDQSLQIRYSTYLLPKIQEVGPLR